MATSRRRWPWTALAAAAMFSCAAYAVAPATPTTQLDRFLKLIGRPSGLPDKALMSRLAPLLSASLANALATARREQLRCIGQYPGDKPPWIEGNLFNSATFETPTGYTIGKARADGKDRWRVPVGFVDAHYKDESRWTDDYLFILDRGQWRLDDVVFRAPFAFGPGQGNRLKPSLLASGC